MEGRVHGWLWCSGCIDSYAEGVNIIAEIWHFVLWQRDLPFFAKHSLWCCCWSSLVYSIFTETKGSLFQTFLGANMSKMLKPFSPATDPEWNLFPIFSLQCWKCTANWRSSWNPKGINFTNHFITICGIKTKTLLVFGELEFICVHTHTKLCQLFCSFKSSFYSTVIGARNTKLTNWTHRLCKILH